MARKKDKDEPLGIKGLVGVGLDGADGHVRISRGQNFYLFGGSKQTHEKMQGVALRFNDRVDERGKTIDEINQRELEEIVDQIHEDEQ